MQNKDICEAFLLIFFSTGSLQVPADASPLFSQGWQIPPGSLFRLLQNRLSHLADGEYDPWPKDPKAIQGSTGWVELLV